MHEVGRLAWRKSSPSVTLTYRAMDWLARWLSTLLFLNWALNSAVECHLHTVEVAGSNPAAPTRTTSKVFLYSFEIQKILLK